MLPPCARREIHACMHCCVALAVQAPSCFTAFTTCAHSSKPSQPALQREMLEDEPRLLAAAQEEHNRTMRNNQVGASALAAKLRSLNWLLVVSAGTLTGRDGRNQAVQLHTHSFVSAVQAAVLQVVCAPAGVLQNATLIRLPLRLILQGVLSAAILPLCACSCRTASPSWRWTASEQAEPQRSAAAGALRRRLWSCRQNALCCLPALVTSLYQWALVVLHGDVMIQASPLCSRPACFDHAPAWWLMHHVLWCKLALPCIPFSSPVQMLCCESGAVLLCM